MRVYSCELVKVIDGDTVKVSIDLGFRVYHTTNIRLKGINAPEMNAAGGRDAKEFLESIISEKLTLECYGYDKYGRWIGIVFNPSGLNLNEEMLASGNARKYDKG